MRRLKNPRNLIDGETCPLLVVLGQLIESLLLDLTFKDALGAMAPTAGYYLDGRWFDFVTLTAAGSDGRELDAFDR